MSEEMKIKENDKDFKSVARKFHKATHKACPFITHQSGPDGIKIVMEIKDYNQSWKVYEAMLKFFSNSTTP